MAFKVGTATNNVDLWNQLIEFLTSDPGLASEDSLWEIVASYTGGSNGEPRHILRGRGSAPNDNIYIGLARTDTPGSDGNRIGIRGMSGFRPNATSWTDHINMTGEMRMWLDVNPMKFWFVANSRRFIVVVNMSTVYEMLYGGFFLPYASPLVYTYPLLIGGCSSAFAGSNSVASWRSQSALHSSFVYAPLQKQNSSDPDATQSSCEIYDYSGARRQIWNDNNCDLSITPRRARPSDSDAEFRWTTANTYTYSYNISGGMGITDYHERTGQCLGGGYALRPFTILQTLPSAETIGVLDGLYACPGVQNAAENIIKIDGVDHLVFQNIWRASTGDYCALRLE